MADWAGLVVGVSVICWALFELIIGHASSFTNGLVDRRESSTRYWIAVLAKLTTGAALFASILALGKRPPTEPPPTPAAIAIVASSPPADTATPAPAPTTSAKPATKRKGKKARTH